MKKYKFESENTTKYTNLHDGFCEKIYYLNNNWYMKLSGIEIEADHPLNPYNKIYLTDDCILEFQEPVMIDYAVQTYNDDFNLTINDNINLKNLNLYSYYENDKISRKYKYAEIGFMTTENDFIVIEFLFKKSIMKWNKFDKISWLECEHCKRNRAEYYQKYSKIMKMLSECNSEEIQQKGIELTKEIHYIDDLLQPYFEGETKSLWKNCAKAIFQKNDDELKNWLLPCSFWLQDMNHPGAEIIAERLKAFSDKDKFLQEKQNAIKIAEIIGDEEWLYNLKEWL